MKIEIPNLLVHLERLKPVEKESLFVKNENTKGIPEKFPHTFNLPVLQFASGDKISPKKQTVGVLFSGGQASGGHNVIIGLCESLKKFHPESRLIGFRGGPDGLLNDQFIELKKEKLEIYRNQGGFDLLGSGRTKIQSEEQFQKVSETVQRNQLTGLVINGGDDSNTNAVELAEYFLQKKIACQVIGVPKTIDGDLRAKYLEISFGFDTATKTYAHTIGSIQRDALSAGKYYFFIKLMGRSASHITLECALQTHPNFAIIGEEVLQKKKTLGVIVSEIASMIVKRNENGKNYGVILVPEGLLEFIPEFHGLIAELNRSLELEMMSPEAKALYQSLPEYIQKQLRQDRDPHGNIQLAKIETERLLIEMVRKELQVRGFPGKFSAQPLYLGYEGRSCYPTPFDATYCLALGKVAALLLAHGLTGYMSSLCNLAAPSKDWVPTGVPLAGLLHFEERLGKQKAVIKKALVELDGEPFNRFKKERSSWQLEDHYKYPLPIQFS